MLSHVSEMDIRELIYTKNIGIQTCNFHLDDVLKFIECLKAEPAPGLDGVHPTVLKKCASARKNYCMCFYRPHLPQGSFLRTGGELMSSLSSRRGEEFEFEEPLL